jgi:2-hydroxychromene-2-carboxylate isomerase
VKRVELYYDYACPYAYLASTQIEALCARTGAELVWRPMLLGGVFRALGVGDGPALGPAKARLNHLDMHRWADWYGVPLVMPPLHPNRTVLALRATLAAEEGALAATRALFRAYWVLGRDVSRPEVVADALAEVGLDAAALLRRADEPSIKEALRARTDEAVARGVFGAPTFFVTVDGKTEKFWGQDRLDFVAKALGDAPLPRGLGPDGSERRADAESAPRGAAPVEGREVSFFFDYSSPFAYLASTQIEALARRARAKVRWRPFLLGALFKSIGTPEVPLLGMPEPKRLLAGLDMNRWAEHLGVPLRFSSHFPMSSVKALRMTLQVPDAQKPPLVHALYRAAWVEDRDIAGDAELASIAASAGLDGAALVAGTRDDAVKARLKAATDEALAAGLCGAPSFLVGDQLFWGQDRLAFVERALQGWRPPVEGPRHPGMPQGE